MAVTTLSDKPDSIAQRLAHDDEIPASAKRLMNLAFKHGWDYETFYSRGQRLAAKKASDNLTVRLTRDNVRLVGIWVDGAWSAGLVGVNGRQQMVVLNSRSFTDAVKDDR